jgi:hemin uptake protein HemP
MGPMSDDVPSSPDNATPTAGTNRSDPPHSISSEELLQGRRELWIEHEGQMYRLRVTSRGKLYLTK